MSAWGRSRDKRVSISKMRVAQCEIFRGNISFFRIGALRNYIAGYSVKTSQDGHVCFSSNGGLSLPMIATFAPTAN